MVCFNYGYKNLISIKMDEGNNGISILIIIFANGLIAIKTMFGK